MRAAFASIDGTRVDQHFGRARYWRIYDINENGGTFVEARRTEPTCAGSCDGGFERILAAVEDCGAVFVLKIGEGAAAFMISRGKRVFEAEGEVEAIIARLAEMKEGGENGGGF
ncbi:MAG: diguanylate cyclase [Clostridiales bacterium]|jgi:predicted Fe-Mo cluster-binding NifX family protein|nr:diguanylate cyclase [Clostridiales bacterium]